ncbi:MAG: hypothetical protein UT42_C0001G0014 [Candidatus Falkowbacteria bacterium GW2011_GWA2_39_24]|uniref:Uncharacterized protein n=1 Tax=Candidatus Falkowbacteria bacterium GW2011_GWA2_39_24 TaxID=1618634 RepID=A0A0G0RPC8_9BACT|nr:MAG: hypothetical protein UT42_C0001G0014 [Candidatus Falkowbacteria bacterium GW2011_GWA2_39_24]
MPKEHKVIIVQGLGRDASKLVWITRFWKKYGLNPIVYSVGWHDTEEGFVPKLNRLLDLIDKLFEEGDIVSLIGTSAGGSAVINAFAKRKQQIASVVNICGRLRVGTHKGIHSFEIRTASSPAFAESVRMCEQEIEQLSSDDKDRIMTVRPLLGDELVPADTVIINGAHNVVIPSGEHVLSIALSLSLLSAEMISFLVKSGAESG